MDDDSNNINNTFTSGEYTVHVNGSSTDTTDSAKTSDSRSKEAWGDIDNESGNKMEYILNPILYALSATGCIGFVDIPTAGHVSKMKRNLSIIYQCAVIVLVATLFVKAVVALFYIPQFARQYARLNVVWLLNMMFYQIVLLKTTHTKYGNLRNGINYWNLTIMPAFTKLGMQYQGRTHRRLSYRIVIIGWTLSIFNFTGAILLAKVLNSDHENEVNSSPFENKSSLQTLFMFLKGVCGAVWIFPNLYTIAMMVTIQKAFSVFNDHVTQLFKENANSLPENFQELRLLHMDLCKFVRIMDADMRWLYGTIFASQLGIACFILYQIIRVDMDTLLLIMFIIWFSGNLANLGSTAAFAAFVNDVAHAPLDIIYDINVHEGDLEKLTQINLFLSKLTGTQVGFTACGLITITKEFILTIAGVFLTYFAVLYTL